MIKHKDFIMTSITIQNNPKPHILIVDDDKEIRTLLSEILEKNELIIFQASQGSEMRNILKSKKIDLMILDINLPDEDGISLCKEVRASSSLPIIMLTAKTSPIERVIGLETGADDYVCKPFEPMELVSRVRSLLRRSKLNSNSEKLSQEASKIYFDSWTLDVLGRHLIRADGMVLSLSASEFNLLKLFIDHANQVMNRDQIMDHIYGRESGPFDRSIDIQVSRLRNKIENNPKSPMIIKTIRSEGYLFTPKVSGSL